MTKTNDFQRLLQLYLNDRAQLALVMNRMSKVQILRFVEWGQDRVEIREIIKILQKWHKYLHILLTELEYAGNLKSKWNTYLGVSFIFSIIVREDGTICI